MAKYIYEYKNWTDFTWENAVIHSIFGEVRWMQGKIIGQMNALGFSAKEEATLNALTLDVVKSSEIEGELLNYEQVRSSIIRRLCIHSEGLFKSNRHIEGIVEMTLGATQRFDLPLTEKRMFGWHAALFPTGFSGQLHRIIQITPKTNIMKQFLTIISLFFIPLNLYSQNKIQLISEFNEPKTKDEFENDLFSGTNKLKFHFEDTDLVLNKDYKIIIKEYKNGKLHSKKVAVNTKEEGLPKIDKDFKFTLIAQQILDNEKIGFFFKNFMNKKIFKVNKKFQDGTFDLRDLTGNTNKIDFELGKEIQIALITPPNENPNAGNLGYCEVSKGNIDVNSWYIKYKIPQFFLIYLQVE